MLCGAVAVAVAVPLSQQATVNTLLDQANAILDQAPIIDGYFALKFDIFFYSTSKFV